MRALLEFASVGVPVRWIIIKFVPKHRLKEKCHLTL
jgi:hypothetical protein